MNKFIDQLRSLVEPSRHIAVITAAMEYPPLISSRRFGDVYTKLRSDKSITDAEKKAIRQAANETLLPPLQLEWGNHGVRKTFRFWGSAEKTTYLRRSMDILHCVRRLTPDVCCGFGTVLGFVRDNDLIAHDDDIDLIAAFSPHEFGSFARAKDALKSHLESEGFTAHGDNLSHFGVTFGAYAACDVFIGFREDDRVSWFPSKRKNLSYSGVFPAKTIKVHKVDCLVPADCEAYLAATYGTNWRTPDPQFNHPWDFSEYRSFT
jgi:hypothetical protein